MPISSKLLEDVRENKFGTVLVLEELDNKDVLLLSQVLSYNIQIRDLGITYGTGQSAESHALVQIIKHASSLLTILTLCMDSLDTIIPLAHALGENATLRAINIVLKKPAPVWTKEEGWTFAQAIRRSRVRTLLLTGIPLDDRGTQELADVLISHSTLTEIIFTTSKQISSAGMQALAKAVGNNSRITSFIFTSKLLTPAIARDMLKILDVNKNLNLISLCSTAGDHSKWKEWAAIIRDQSAMGKRNRELAALPKQAPTPEPVSPISSASSLDLPRLSSRQHFTLCNIADQKHAFEDYQAQMNPHPRLQEYYLGVHGLLVDTILGLKSVNSQQISGTNAAATLINLGHHGSGTVAAGLEKTKTVIGLSVLTAGLCFILNEFNDIYILTMANRVSRLFVNFHDIDRIPDALALILTMHQQARILALPTLDELFVPYRTYLEAREWFNGKPKLTEVSMLIREDIRKILLFWKNLDKDKMPVSREWMPELLMTFGMESAHSTELIQQFFPASSPSTPISRKSSPTLGDK